MLLITHHLDLAARFADRILLMDCGRAVAEGLPAQVYTEPVLEQVYRWPLSVRTDEYTGSPRVIPRDADPSGRPPAPPHEAPTLRRSTPLVATAPATP